MSPRREGPVDDSILLIQCLTFMVLAAGVVGLLFFPGALDWLIELFQVP